MASGGNVSGNVNIQKLQDDVLKLWTVVKSLPESAMIRRIISRLCTMASQNHSIHLLKHHPLTLVPAAVASHPNSFALESRVSPSSPPIKSLFYISNAKSVQHGSTAAYLDIIHEIATSGTSFKDKNALLTGVGKGSKLSKTSWLEELVVITTSSYSRKAVEYYKVGSWGSSLTVVPFSQGSKQDMEALVEYIYTSLGMDLDYILPFAGIPENGREIDSLDDRSELAHRMMLVNLLRILGVVKNKKASRHFVTRSIQVILPLSPNHGLFGNGGLYSESKITLETLFQRWASESWGEYLCLAGAVIGCVYRHSSHFDCSNISFQLDWKILMHPIQHRSS